MAVVAMALMVLLLMAKAKGGAHTQRIGWIQTMATRDKTFTCGHRLMGLHRDRSIHHRDLLTMQALMVVARELDPKVATSMCYRHPWAQAAKSSTHFGKEVARPRAKANRRKSMETPLVARLRPLNAGDGLPEGRGERPAGPDPTQGQQLDHRGIGHLCQSNHSRAHHRGSGLEQQPVGPAPVQKGQYLCEQRARQRHLQPGLRR